MNPELRQRQLAFEHASARLRRFTERFATPSALGGRPADAMDDEARTELARLQTQRDDAYRALHGRDPE
jgi:hypothetical protein